VPLACPTRDAGRALSDNAACMDERGEPAGTSGRRPFRAAAARREMRSGCSPTWTTMARRVGHNEALPRHGAASLR